MTERNSCFFNADVVSTELYCNNVWDLNVMVDSVNWNNLLPELSALRRDFHKYPELGFQEVLTQEKIIQYLEALGLATARMAGTGVVGFLPGERPGKTILLRSDMDALPVPEETHLAFQSVHEGVMHACGHDGHMAMLLVAAKVLSGLRKNIPGNIVFAFQPNEEDAGAWKMIEAGIMERYKVDAAFGCHLWNPIKTGRIDICDGPIMAASHYFTITVKGSGGHAGFAHESIDPIFVSSHIIQAVQAIQTRQVDALEPVVIMFTRIQGGTNTTIIPEKVVLEGSIRFLSEDGQKILGRFERTVKDICSLHGADCSLAFKVGNNMLSNDSFIAEIARHQAGEILESKEDVTSDIRTMAGEDFAEFARKVPAAFAFVGAEDPTKEKHYPHHHPCFDFDERAMIPGTRLFVRVALGYLTENNR